MPLTLCFECVVAQHTFHTLCVDIALYGAEEGESQRIQFVAIIPLYVLMKLPKVV